MNLSGSLYNVSPNDYGQEYQNHLLEQYKLYVQMADKIRVVVLLMLSMYPNNHDERQNNPNPPLPPLWWHQRHSTWIHQER
jgi:hypothetical protein